MNLSPSIIGVLRYYITERLHHESRWVTSLRRLAVGRHPGIGGRFTVKIGGVKAKGGKILVALYDKEPLFSGNPPYSAEVPVTAGGEAVVVLRNVVAGDYVVSAFHDADGDGRPTLAGGKLTEGTALSNAEQLRGAPSFAVNKIAIPQANATVSVTMSYPEDRKDW